MGKLGGKKKAFSKIFDGQLVWAGVVLIHLKSKFKDSRFPK